MTEEIVEKLLWSLSESGILCWHELDRERMVITISIDDSVYWMKKTKRIIAMAVECIKPAGILVEIIDNRGYINIIGKIYWKRV